MPKISKEQLDIYFNSGGSYYPLYKDSVKLYNDLRVHADGEFPGDMIKRRRPSETDEILAYRQETYKPITKLPISQVVNSFSKIRRSPDWAIDFPKETVPSKIIEDETLEKYCTETLPGFVSITDWAFGILLKQNLIDANAVIAVIPLDPITESEYIKPVPILFNSNQIYQYDEKEKYCILKSKIKTSYNNIDVATVGDRFYYIDDTVIQIYEQNKNGYQLTFEAVNIIQQFPVFKIKAETFKQFDNMSLNKSRLDAMVAFLDEAACEYSDLKGSKIQHLYPLFWYYQNKSCNSCNGTGKTTQQEGAPVECKSCSGSGKVIFSPFAHIQVDPAGLGNQANPVPPAGYVTRDTAILEMQEKSVDKNNFKALASMNMQFLSQTPLSISGDAKSVDREELNNTVYNSAEDLVYSIDKVIYFMNEWRYFFLVPDKLQRKLMLPNIPVPDNFDLLPEDYLMKEVADARTAKINPLLIATLEQQLAAKKFYNQPDLASNIKLYFDLDPLPGLSVDEKMSLISNKAITIEDFVISSYMASFIKRALREDKEFDKKPYNEQIKLLQSYADEKIKTIDQAQKMIDQQKQNVLKEMQQQQGNNAANPGNGTSSSNQPAAAA